MNPWAFVVIGLAILLIIIGIKGTQHNIAGAVTGRLSGSNPPVTGKTGVNSKGQTTYFA